MPSSFLHIPRTMSHTASEGTRQARIPHPHRITETSKLYQWADHASLVLQCLNEQRHQGLFCDVILVTEEQRVLAHRNILAASSDYFNAMFTLDMREAYQKEVELFGTSYIGLKAILDFLYGCELSLDSGNIEYVLETAHLLQIWEVVDFCCEYLENVVNEKNYLYLQELAFIYNLKSLDSNIDAFVLSNFGTLSLTDNFLQNASPEKLCQYLGSNDVQHEREHDLLQAAMWWIKQDPERETEAYRVLENVRFSLIPKSDLLNTVKPAVCSLNCEGLVEEAIHYHDNVTAQPVLQNKRTVLRGSDKLLVLSRDVKFYPEIIFLDTKTGKWVCETYLLKQQIQPCVAALGGFIFVAGGIDENYQFTNRIHRYDPRCNQWIQLASMRQARHDFYLAPLKDRLVAIGGRSESKFLSSVEIYSPEKDEWVYVEDLPRLTFGYAAAVHNEFVYISGGEEFDDNPYANSFKNLFCYDYQRDVWEEKRPMITARHWHSMCTLRENIYSIGGSVELGPGRSVDILDVECYSPLCNQWTRVSSLLQASSDSGVAVWEGKIYVLGGCSMEERLDGQTVQVYDIETNKWQKGTDLPRTIRQASACVCVLKALPDE